MQLKPKSRSAGFQTCRTADFQIGIAPVLAGTRRLGNLRYSRLGSLRYLALFLTTICLLLIPAAAADQKPLSGKKAEAAAANEFFKSTKVLRIQIEIPEESINKLRKYQWQFGPREERESVQATVREGSLVLTNVAVHLKGSAGSFRSITENPALTLTIDKSNKDQNFHGLTKFSLNNSVQDPTLISEQFSREMFLKAGVPAPRATHAVVELNGRDLGLYVLIEGFNKQFLKQYFKKTDGNLYDGGFIKDVTDELAVNSGQNPKDQKDRIALADAASEPNLANRMERLEKVLDMDRFLSFIALDVMLWDWDGYAMNKNNWRLFHDEASDKMVFLPHGLDQMYWKPDGSILPPMKGLVARAVLEVPELRTRYFERIKKLRATVYNVETMTNRVNEISAKISPILKEKYPDVAKEQERAASNFCFAIARRARSIDEQLGAPITPLDFDASGAAALTRWESKSDFGHPAMSREPIDGGKESLHLATTSGSSVGTWRSRFWLEKGRYKVEGRVKTRDLVPDVGDTRGGAGLRLAGGRAEKYSTATSDWSTVSNEFAIGDALGEVQILCEFRGAEGEAWFDLKSIRLLRLPSDKK
jgi:spore coat protein H